MVGGRCDVVVFEDNRCFVVASSAPDPVLQPRHPTESELAVRDGSERFVEVAGNSSVGFVDIDGRVAGAVTAWGTEPAVRVEAWHGMARLVTSVLAATGHDASFFESAVQGLRDTVIVLSPDMEIVWVNDAVGSLLGRTPAEAIGRSAAEFVHPDDLAMTVDAISRIRQGLELFRLTVRLRGAAGDWVPVEVTGADHSLDPTLGGLVLSLRYADYESELGTTIDRVERMSKAIVSGLRDGIVATDQFGAVTVVNDVARTMFGVAADAPASSLTLDDFELLDENGRRRNLTVDSVDDGAPMESCVVSPRGEIRYVTITSMAVTDDHGDYIGTVVAFHDVTAEHLAREELRSQALHDQLTGLANRRQLETRLGELSLVSPAVDVGVCFIDLDGFKLVNDNHGHRTGDQLIGIAARRLARQLRHGDLLVRHGGDEFVALLVDVESIDVAVAAAERCLTALSEPYEIGDDRFDLTASIGVAIASSTEAHTGVLLQHADIALYAAKNRGRNRIEPFDESLAEAVSVEQHQRQLLRDALENDRFVMHFQPLVDAVSGATVGYEALARIRTEEGDVIGPPAFMESIANTGLMWDLDQTAFVLSCEAAVLLDRLSDDVVPYLACNFSAVSLTHPEFLPFIDAAIATTGADPCQIYIEITESAAFDVGPAGLATLSALSDRGFRIALDDFGTGYSSLAHLRDLPISTVKVDRSFIVQLAKHDSERAIAAAIVTLARELDLGTVAEGVETQVHEDQAQQLGFTTLQGWRYSHALSLADCLDDWNAQQSD